MGDTTHRFVVLPVNFHKMLISNNVDFAQMGWKPKNLEEKGENDVSITVVAR